MNIDELIAALRKAESNIVLVQMYVSQESEVLQEDTTEAHLWDALEHLNQAIACLSPLKDM
jgi:hypothetical protein